MLDPRSSMLSIPVMTTDVGRPRHMVPGFLQVLLECGSQVDRGGILNYVTFPIMDDSLSV
jgi:hypothetical protein